MANSLPAVPYAVKFFFSTTLIKRNHPREHSPTVANPLPMKKVCVRKEKLAINLSGERQLRHHVQKYTLGRQPIAASRRLFARTLP